MLEASLRPGWSVRTTRGLEAAVTDGVLRVRPSEKTGLFASVLLVAANGSPIDVTPFDHLAMEVNTLPDAGGRHRVPLLRVGLSDASGRSRQPLLARYVQFDTDPSTWQQVLVPLADLLDRGVRADAIDRLSWQYAGAAFPFAVRRVSLIPRAPVPPGSQSSVPNLLSDPSFETRSSARPVWSLVGDYRDDGHRNDWRLQEGNAADGRRFLRVRGMRPYLFEALGPRAGAVGFGVALRAEDPSTPAEREGGEQTGPAAVEIGCQVVGFGSQGGVAVAASASRRVAVNTGWRRYALAAAVAPGTMPPAEADLCLYRGWIRPLSPGVAIDVDAVYLSNAVVPEDTFEGQPANLLAEGVGVYRQARSLLSYRPLAPELDQPLSAGFQVDLPPSQALLEAREWAGRQWPRAIVCGTVPFARGVVYSPDSLRLRAADGSEIPFQYEVLRRDTRDGSVRILWMAFECPMAAGERLRLSLESGAVSASGGPNLAYETDDGILVNTGALRMRLRRDASPFFPETQWGAEASITEGEGGIRLMLSDGRTFRAAGAPSYLTVERNGPLAAVVSVRGYLTGETRGPAVRVFYHARLRFWKGVPGVQVDLAVTNVTPQPALPIEALAFDVPTSRAREVLAAIGRDGSPPLSIALRREQFLRVTQRRDPFRSGAEELYVEMPGGEPTVQPGRAGGWARWESPGQPFLVLGFHRMADRHPAALEVGTRRLTAYLVPPSGVKAFHFPFGMTAYGEFWIGSGEAPQLVLDRLSRPPLVTAAPAYAASTGVFGVLPPPERVSRLAPVLAAVLQGEFALALGHSERTGENGLLNEGDAGTFGWWRRGDTDDAESFYLQYLAT
ncbi:MAG: hypothetical protein QHJ73_09370, partial [Armatimonadota bacterium]|nr:hypothetical protein [Armatimonadota bacterium]